MENKRFEHIITRYLKGKATPEEEAELLQAIHASKEWEAAFRKRTAEWNPLEETEADPETDRKWNRIASIITPSESQSQTEEAPVISLVSTSSRRIWFSIAAVVLLLLVSGVTVYFLNQGGKAGTGAERRGSAHRLELCPAHHRLPRPVEPVGKSGLHLLA